jgi:hypothetical protein
MSRLTASSRIGERLLRRGVVIAVVAAITGLALIWAAPPGPATAVSGSLTMQFGRQAIPPSSPVTFTGTLSGVPTPAGQTITVNGSNIASPIQVLGTTTTDTNGNYSLALSGLPYGTWLVQAVFNDGTNSAGSPETDLYVGTGLATVSVMTGATTPVGHALAVQGRLSVAAGDVTINRIVHLTASLPGKTSRDLGTTRVTTSGWFKLVRPHGLPTAGMWRVTATFTDPAYLTTTGTGVYPIGLRSSVRLATSARLVTYGNAVRITVRVGAHAVGDYVYVYQAPYGHAKRLLARKRLGRGGVLVMVTKPRTRTWYSAAYLGNRLRLPSGSSSVPVGVRVAVHFFAVHPNAVRNGTTIFKYTTACVTSDIGCPNFAVIIGPRLSGVPVTYVFNVQVSGHWVFGDAVTFHTVNGVDGIDFQYLPAITKYVLRVNVRAVPSPSSGLSPTTSPWIRWRVVR